MQQHGTANEVKRDEGKGGRDRVGDSWQGNT